MVVAHSPTLLVLTFVLLAVFSFVAYSVTLPHSQRLETSDRDLLGILLFILIINAVRTPDTGSWDSHDRGRCHLSGIISSRPAGA